MPYLNKQSRELLCTEAAPARPGTVLPKTARKFSLLRDWLSRPSSPALPAFSLACKILFYPMSKGGEVSVYENHFLFIHGLVLKCKLQHSNLFLICSWMPWTKRQKVFPKPDVKLPETLSCASFPHYKKGNCIHLILSSFLCVERIHCLFINKLPFNLNETYMPGYFSRALKQRRDFRDKH